MFGWFRSRVCRIAIGHRFPRDGDASPLTLHYRLWWQRSHSNLVVADAFPVSPTPTADSPRAANRRRHRFHDGGLRGNAGLRRRTCALWDKLASRCHGHRPARGCHHFAKWHAHLPTVAFNGWTSSSLPGHRKRCWHYRIAGSEQGVVARLLPYETSNLARYRTGCLNRQPCDGMPLEMASSVTSCNLLLTWQSHSQRGERLSVHQPRGRPPEKDQIMSTAALFLADSLSDLHLKDFSTEIQDSGRVKLGGGFSPLSKPPLSKTRPTTFTR
jgi:hypothetical protein